MADRVSIMNLRQLPYWLAVVATGSFTKAPQLHEKAAVRAAVISELGFGTGARRPA
jgi:hypothetical protein